MSLILEKNIISLCQSYDLVVGCPHDPLTTGGIEQHSSGAHFLGEMAVIKRVLTLWVALAFLLGATARLLPCSMAQTDPGLRADNPAECAGPNAPCADQKPTCIGHLGCIACPALPYQPASPPIAFHWKSVTYDFVSESMAGHSVEPELAPPILAA